jgi:hypothetical protein
VTKREVNEAEENALIEALRGDFHGISAFALLSGIRESGLCTLDRSKLDLVKCAGEVPPSGRRARLHSLGDPGAGSATGGVSRQYPGRKTPPSDMNG